MATNIFIFIGGLLLYALYGTAGVCYLIGTTLFAYWLGRLIPKHRFWMWLGIAVQILALLIVRAQPVLRWGIAAPLGISYFTLQIIAYFADIARGKYKPEKNLVYFGLYVTYLPHIFLGPIEPYAKMREAIARRRVSWDGISCGAVRVLWGLFKKLVIAARAGVIVSAISADPAQYQGVYALAAMLLYSIQLYTDFSGGIDIALGVSQMMGIRLSENFDAPYFSESIQEFWRRWHITLGAWLREYVYIPLGGNRKGKLRKVVNTLVTFLVSGLWHGTSYLLWGVLHGAFVSLGSRLQTRCKTVNRIGTFLVVSFLWSFFIWQDTATSLRMMLSVFTHFYAPSAFAAIAAMGLTVGDWAVLLVSAAMLWIYDWKRDAIRSCVSSSAPAARTALICGLGLLVALFGMYGIGFEAADFIYSRF